MPSKYLWVVNVHSLSVRASGPLNCQHGCRRQTGAECGVGQSGGGAPSMEQATTGGHLGDMETETDSRGSGSIVGINFLFVQPEP